MTDSTFEAFERRLAAALDDYASDAGPMPDPFVRAHDIARAHPRRRALVPMLGFHVRPAWLVLAMLVAGLIAGLILAGTQLPRRPVPLIPAQLFGRWSANDAGDPFLDLSGESLIGSTSGQSQDLGRVVAFEGDPSRSLETIVEIDGAFGCSSGRYRLVLGRLGGGELPGPTAAPLESGRDAGPLIIESMRFTRLDDSCVPRVDLLVSGPWRRVVHLLGLKTVDSLAFTEPFEISALPETTASVGSLYQDVANTRVHVSHPWWNGAFLDDEPVNRDVCNPLGGRLPELPNDLPAITEWLRAAGPRLEGPTPVVIDGRTALRWKNQGACGDAMPEITGGVYGDVIYAIPTGDDVIIWAFRFDTAAEEMLGDAVARSIHFE